MDKWIMYIISLLLGMLMFYILKDVCGCGNIVEGGFFDTVEKDLGFGPPPPKTCTPPKISHGRYCLNKCSDNNDTLKTNFRNPECLCKYGDDGQLMTYSDMLDFGLKNPKPLLTNHNPRTCQWYEWKNGTQWQDLIKTSGADRGVTATH